MFSSSKIKSVDFYRKIPRDLTEASLSGAGLSIIAALAMMFLFGMELNDYLTVSTTTSIVVDNSSDGDFLRIDFNISFPALSCEFASVDVSDVLGTNRLNITKTIRKFSIDPDLRPTGAEFRSGPLPHYIKHGDEVDEETNEGSVALNSASFDKLSHQETHGHHEHESYYGDRDTDTLVKTMEDLVDSIPQEDQKIALEDKSNVTKRPAPLSGGCRIEGYVRVKKVPGNLIISARSGSHSFDASKMNMSHVISHLSFGKTVSPQVLNDVKRLIPYLGRSHDKLNGRSFINHRDLDANVTIEHYLQVVKTEVVTTKSSHDHRIIEEYEYTAHSSLAQSVYIPVAKFHFELSPMQVLVTEDSKSFSHFLTNVCAIIGGVFTVAGILDSIFHNTIRLMKKVEIGKNY
ncbi:Protein disulfide-isomerase 5-3 -like protein [Gossypium arboreum]|uniref:Protein disulfide-isomerase 5-3-like protein n=1 Tax=Gossypium arboreum TaxID=29729 RepID=A0A0B0PK40_GOSAR|nr:Protein disulfide-isomerase 5-3 -like protein [Gossypium arboreum]